MAALMVRTFSKSLYRGTETEEESNGSMAGYILKKGPKFYAQNRRRWFVLDSEACLLRYYENDTKEVELGVIDVHPQACTVYGSAFSDWAGHHQLSLATGQTSKGRGRIYELYFIAKVDEDTWWVALMAAQHNAHSAKIEANGGWESILKEHKKQQSAEDKSAASLVNPEPDDNTSKPVEPGLMKQAKHAYDEVLEAIIRPPRSIYTMSKLGPKRFRFLGNEYMRSDIELLNNRNQLLRISVWDTTSNFFDHAQKSEDGKSAARARPAVVYMHGNASCRLAAFEMLSLVLYNGFMAVVLDCSGSGHSEGDYVSLGHFESDDLKAVVDHLRTPRASLKIRDDHGRDIMQPPKMGRVAVWGRSMGAVAAILYAAKRDPTCSALILDSGFSSLEHLARDLVKKATSLVPNWLVRSILSWVRSSALHRAGFDINEIDCLKVAPVCQTPALYLAGQDDDFVSPKHSKALCDIHGSKVVVPHQAPKMMPLLRPVSSEKGRGPMVADIVVVPGKHNDSRPLEAYGRIETFLRTQLLDEETTVEGGVSYAERLFGIPFPPELMPKRLRGREYPLMSVAALPPWRLETVLKKAGARQKKSWKVASPQTSQTTRVDSGDAADDSSASTDVATEESGVTSGMSSDRQEEVTAMVGNLFMKSRGE